MSLTLDPEIETQVRREAARRGVSPQDFLRGTLDFALSPDPGPAALSATELQIRICEGFTEAFWQTYRSLLQKRAAGTLTPEEQQQLIALSDEIEERDGQRLVYLTELARRRSVPVRTLMQQLGLRPATVA